MVEGPRIIDLEERRRVKWFRVGKASARLPLENSQGLQQQNFNTMADYKTYLAASILTEDKVVRFQTKIS